MESKLNVVPEKLDRVNGLIDATKTEYEKLLQLRPIYGLVSVGWPACVNLKDYFAKWPYFFVGVKSVIVRQSLGV